MLIFLLVCVGMVVLLGRLYYWQVLRGAALAQLANSEHIQNQIVNAPRGLIYDAQGHILATNVVRDDVYIEPYQFSAIMRRIPSRVRSIAWFHLCTSVLPAVSTETLV